ncbi:MAG: hypothetical protein ABI249_00560, partial [Ornithinibacter sp.]
AKQSITLQGQLNGIIAAAATADSVKADVADVATAFKSNDWTPVAGAGSIPTNVATICTWTWMCLLGDIHANDTGYAVMAATVAGRL